MNVLGLYNEAVVLIEDCISSIEKQFGCNSVEVVSELQKLFDVVSLVMADLTKKGKTASREYRSKLQKLKATQLKIQKFIKANVAASYLNSIPGMTEALNSVELS
ncbi:hypothetical protein J6590_018940 [Homalodisca vitripennis]|nr:hypothetical protein J6590_081164 [Homalodisca vitripennis]KAG8283348.1 hypothetical protein J6590_018940 [Homalodisca vitripennis]